VVLWESNLCPQRYGTKYWHWLVWSMGHTVGQGGATPPQLVVRWPLLEVLTAGIFRGQRGRGLQGKARPPARTGSRSDETFCKNEDEGGERTSARGVGARDGDCASGQGTRHAVFWDRGVSDNSLLGPDPLASFFWERNTVPILSDTLGNRVKQGAVSQRVVVACSSSREIDLCTSVCENHSLLETMIGAAKVTRRYEQGNLSSDRYPHSHA